MDRQPPAPASESSVLGHLCMPVPVPVHPSSSGKGGWDHRSPTQAQHTAVWTMRDQHHRPRPGDLHPFGLGKRTFIMLGLILSTVAMKLALP